MLVIPVHLYLFSFLLSTAGMGGIQGGLQLYLHCCRNQNFCFLRCNSFPCSFYLFVLTKFGLEPSMYSRQMNANDKFQ
jgi:hypothetical protein